MLQTPGQRDLAEAQARIARMGDDARVQTLDKLEHVWGGTQYEARASFWDKDVPVQERAPCIVHPVARIAGSRIASLVFGESRFPRITPIVGTTEVGGLQVSDLDAKALSEFVVALLEAASIKLTARAMLIDGLKTGTACLVLSLRAGLPRVDLLPAKWCTPTFDSRDPDRVIKLVMQYRHEVDGKSVWYRREISEKADREWRDVPCRSDGHQPDWDSIQPAADIAIEFCPVIWARNLTDSSCYNELDGIAIADGLFDEIEALDLAHSMRHRNALYNGDPVPVFTGAGPEDVEAATGRDGPNQHGYTSASSRGIKKGPGTIVYLNKEGAGAMLLESSGAGNKILGDDADAISRMLYEAMNVVVADPSIVGSGDLSARALMLLFAPMVDLADSLRECWGRVLRRTVGMMLRLCAGMHAERDGVFVRGINLVRPILRRFFVAMRRDALDVQLAAPTVWRWVDPPMSLTWGPYFQPSQAELQAAATTLTTATGGQPIMSQRAAVAKFQSIANLEDSADSELAAIKAESDAGREAMGGMLGSIGGGGQHFGR